MEDTAEKYRTIKKLNFLIMKVNSIGNMRIDLEIPQKYSGKLVERLEASKKRNCSPQRSLRKS